MIKIKRGECPVVLQGVSDRADRYSDPEVIARLAEMQHFKCCYCEKWIGQAGQDRAVEHFRPKGSAHFPELANEWSNLLHACTACNGKKRDAFPTASDGSPLIIDPSDPALNPEDHLDFRVDDTEPSTFGSIREKGDYPDLGKQTINCVGLDVAMRRAERASIYKKLLSSYVDMLLAGPDPVSKQQAKEAFRNLLTANNEYAGFARAFARAKNVEAGFGVSIPVGYE